MWSGGKDAMLTLDVLHSQSPRRVGALLTTVTDEHETVTMHGTALSFVERQAEALGLPLHVMWMPAGAPNAVYEERLEHALGPLLEEGGGPVAVGDLFLEDVRAYRKAVLEQMGATVLFPLWKRDTTRLAQRFLDRGYRAIVTSVDTTRLDPDFVGRPYDQAFLDALPDNVDACGEEGAFHTAVLDGPPFADPLTVETEGTYSDGRMHYIDLRRAHSDGSSGTEATGAE